MPRPIDEGTNEIKDHFHDTLKKTVNCVSFSELLLFFLLFFQADRMQECVSAHL